MQNKKCYQKARKKQEPSCFSDCSISSCIPDCFSTVISGLAPSTYLPPYHACTPPLLFHSHTLCHSSSGPLEVYGKGPQFCLSRDRPVKSQRLVWRRVRKSEKLTEKRKGKLAFLRLCMHSTFLIYSTIYPLNNSSTYYFMAVWLQRNIIIHLISRCINRPLTYEHCSGLCKSFNICNIKQAAWQIHQKPNI